MGAPNTTLITTRRSMRMSQDDFAHAIQAAGQRIGVQNSCTKRMVQRWESGQVSRPRGTYARALEAATGLPIEMLGFPAGADAVVLEDGRGGHDLAVRPTDPAPVGDSRNGNLSGVWLSHYKFFSSGREAAFDHYHYAVLMQHGSEVSVRSIEGSGGGSDVHDSLMTMTLQVEGSVATGTWMEQTHEGGYYKGARYFGAIQMMADPTGRQLVGKWVGFGKEMALNTGPWTLKFQDASLSKSTLAKYSAPAEQAA